MISRQVPMVGALLIVAGCAATEPQQVREAVAPPPVVQVPAVSYVAPDPSTPAPEVFVVNAPVNEALAQVVGALNGPRFGITHLDERAGLLTATYRGDPSPYVECGQLLLESSRGQVREVPGAVANLRYEIPSGSIAEGFGEVTRDLDLDSYMIVEVAPQTPGSAQVSVTANYVLTRTSSVSGAGLSATERSWLAFSTGESAVFDEGGPTRCQPNGELEAVVLGVGRTADPVLADVRSELARVPCAALTAGRTDDGAVIVSGIIGSNENLNRLSTNIRSMAAVRDVLFRTEVTPPPFCNFLEATAPFELANQNQQLGSEVGLLGGTELVQGDLLVVQANAPRFESHVYLFYVQSDGRVIHLLPNGRPGSQSRPVEAQAELVVGDDPREPTYRVTPPFGRDLIVLVASATPLFAELRPQIDQAAVLTKDLAASLQRARDAGAQVAATHLFVQTSPVSN